VSVVDTLKKQFAEQEKAFWYVLKQEIEYYRGSG